MKWSISALGITLLAAWSFADAPKDGPAPTPQCGAPVTHANLTVFPLRGKDTVPSSYKLLTLQEALEQKKVLVHETSEVNELSIENVASDVDIFVQSGDIVRGGKQDRLIASDMVISAKSGRIPIPSFCCESGRWRKRGGENDAQFEKSVAQAGNRSLKLALNQERDQNRVWDEVKKSQMKLSQNIGKDVTKNSSPSSYQLALEDKELQAKLDAYILALSKCTQGDDIIGFAFAINGKLAGAEVYGSADLFKKLWPKLLHGAAIDALAEFVKDKKLDAVSIADAEKFLSAAQDGKRSELKLEKPTNVNRAGRAPNQAANQSPAQPPQQQAPPTPQGTPPADAKPSRIRNIQCETPKSLMLECQDAKIGNTVVHRSYIAK